MPSSRKASRPVIVAPRLCPNMRIGDRGVVAGPCSSLGAGFAQARRRFPHRQPPIWVAHLAFEKPVGRSRKEDKKPVATQPLPGVSLWVRPGWSR